MKTIFGVKMLPILVYNRLASAVRHDTTVDDYFTSLDDIAAQVGTKFHVEPARLQEASMQYQESKNA